MFNQLMVIPNSIALFFFFFLVLHGAHTPSN